jgi:protein TonB
VARIDTLLARFLALSIAIHVIAFMYVVLIQRTFARPQSQSQQIAVSLLPPSEREPTQPAPAQQAPATRAAKIPAKIAKKDSRIIAEVPTPTRGRVTAIDRDRKGTSENPPILREKATTSERILGDQTATVSQIAREPAAEKSVLAERPLPSVKELLPSITYSGSGGRGSAPVSLNTKDPTYITYFNKIKQSINLQWEYPEIARRYGFQGKLILEFTITENGRIEQLRLVRSSGYNVLDEEAMRAIVAAAPFPPIPSWIKPSPLRISASMEYHDSRLDYRALP